MRKRNATMLDRWDVPEVLRRKMVEVARVFRKQPTATEAILWQVLRARKMDGIKFRRQQNIGPFVVDFCAAEHRLIVEVDGPIHEVQKNADQCRQQLLESLGLRFLRPPTELVEKDLPAALAAIRAGIRGDSLTPGPLPHKEGEGENSPGPSFSPRSPCGRAGEQPRALFLPLPLFGGGGRGVREFHPCSASISARAVT